MNEVIAARVAAAKASTPIEEKLLLQQIVQEISLLGLWRSKLAERAAFYGGTALRIIHGLDRFSEDLDFTLLEPDKEFDGSRYYQAISMELEGYGFDVRVERKEKGFDSPVESAFIKADTHVCFIVARSRFKAQKGSLIKVKLEIDTEAPRGFTTDVHPLFWPQAFSVLTCDLPSLMAGKLHAAFCRTQRTNVKGRDWYDLIWYAGRGINPNWGYLESKLRLSGHWSSQEFSVDLFKNWAVLQVEGLDIEAAKQDIARFIPDPSSLDAWSQELFLAIIKRLT